MFEVGKRYRGDGGRVYVCAKHDASDNTFRFDEESGIFSVWTCQNGLGFWTRERLIFGEYLDAEAIGGRIASRIMAIIEEEIAKYESSK